MRRTSIIVIGIFVHILCFSFAGTLSARQSGEVERKTIRTDYLGNWYSGSYAFVVGIDDGRKSDRPSPLSASEGAKHVAVVLEKQGFKVITLLNDQATKSEIMRYLTEVIPPQLSQGDRFVFYFGGPGLTQNTDSGHAAYLIPADAKKTGDADLWWTYISIRDLRDLMKDRYESKHTLVIVDACISGLMTDESERMPGENAVEALKNKGQMILAAGVEEDRDAEGRFAPALVKGMSGRADFSGDGFVTFRELADYVKNDIGSRSRQMPHYGWWSGKGEMIFKPGPVRYAEKGLQSPVDKEALNNKEDDILIVSHNYYTQNADDDGRDRFTTTECRSVTDAKTGLEWIAGSDADMSYAQAKEWINRLELCGGGWRMPTTNELEALKGKNDAYRPFISAVKIPGGRVWAVSSANEREVRFFDFGKGEADMQDRNDARGFRALAVRHIQK